MTDVRYTNVCTHDGQHGRLIFTADKLQREKLHQERRLQWHSSLQSVFCVKKIEPLCYWVKLISNSCLFSLFSLSLSPPPSPALSSPLFLTCIALHQPLPLSAAGVREGEGKPGGADGALLQGAPGKSRLWQHQERRHARADVSEAATHTHTDMRPNIFLWYVVEVLTEPKEGCVLKCCVAAFLSVCWLARGGRDKVNARLHSCQNRCECMIFVYRFVYIEVSPARL